MILILTSMSYWISLKWCQWLEWIEQRHGRGMCDRCNIFDEICFVCSGYVIAVFFLYHSFTYISGYLKMWGFIPLPSTCIHKLYWKEEQLMYDLTHWGRVTHISVSKVTIIGSDNGLSPGRRQAIIWTNAGILLIGPLGANFSEILIEILTFWFRKMRLKCRLRNSVHFVSASMC